MRRCADGNTASPAAQGRIGRCLRRAALLALTPLALTAPGWAADNDAAGAVPALDERVALAAGEAAIGRSVPDMTLLDRQRRPVRLADYRGKPLLVSFVYTGCFQVCPTQTRALLEAVKGLERTLGPGQFNVVSIGFNQPFDSPEAMRVFATQHRVDPANWEFLSPAREQVEPLARAFGFSYVATPAGFDHVLGVTVVDREGRIHAQVYGDRLRADQLGVPLRRLVLDAPPANASATAALAAMVDRVRILCTIYDADTGEYRYDVKLILEIIGGALFFFGTAIYLLVEWRDQRRARRQSCAAHRQASGSMA
jgi:protein SCO1/2